MLSYNGKPTWLGRWLWGKYADQNALLYTLIKTIRKTSQIYMKGSRNMSIAFDKLKEEVEQNKTVVASAILLITTLAEKIRESAADEAAMLALADELDAKTNELAGAVEANTEAPTEPEVPVEPTAE